MRWNSFIAKIQICQIVWSKSVLSLTSRKKTLLFLSIMLRTPLFMGEPNSIEEKKRAKKFMISCLHRPTSLRCLCNLPTPLVWTTNWFHPWQSLDRHSHGWCFYMANNKSWIMTKKLWALHTRGKQKKNCSRPSTLC